MGLTGAAGPGAVDVFGDSNCSIIDGEKTDNGDRMLFGFCDFGDWQCAEFGYVLLIQVASWFSMPLGSGLREFTRVARRTDR